MALSARSLAAVGPAPPESSWSRIWDIRPGTRRQDGSPTRATRGTPRTLPPDPGPLRVLTLRGTATSRCESRPAASAAAAGRAGREDPRPRWRRDALPRDPRPSSPSCTGPGSAARRSVPSPPLRSEDATPWQTTAIEQIYRDLELSSRSCQDHATDLGGPETDRPCSLAAIGVIPPRTPTSRACSGDGGSCGSVGAESACGPDRTSEDLLRRRDVAASASSTG